MFRSCHQFWLLAALCSVLSLASGCAAIPEKLYQPQFHNPFPQLHRVAVLPFFNQSAEPTVDGEAVAIAYYNELQAIPGFEVMPVGVARQLLAASRIEPRSASDFQKLARLMNVDAVLVGSVTEYSPYYPPRIGIAVDWYAANPGFHPIPAGYGLPWGTSEEEYIPGTLVEQAEFELARTQLETQAPPLPPDESMGEGIAPAVVRRASQSLPLADTHQHAGAADGMPADWPDPRGFIPPPPSSQRPALRPQYDPIISHVHVYHGNDSNFTQRLESYFDFREDARFGGWEGFLQRPDDFLRFCCHLHVTETLAARGGAGDSQVVWRWPISRYER